MDWDKALREYEAMSDEELNAWRQDASTHWITKAFGEVMERDDTRPGMSEDQLKKLKDWLLVVYAKVSVANDAFDPDKRLSEAEQILKQVVKGLDAELGTDSSEFMDFDAQLRLAKTKFGM